MRGTVVRRAPAGRKRLHFSGCTGVVVVPTAQGQFVPGLVPLLVWLEFITQSLAGEVVFLEVSDILYRELRCLRVYFSYGKLLLAHTT